MDKIRLIDTRRYVNLKKENLKKEDRRFLLTIYHDEVLFNENMLLQNRVLLIAVFALFVALLSLILNIKIISDMGKAIFITILSIFSLWLVVAFYNALKRVKAQNEHIKVNYDELFKYHLNYALRKV